MSDGISGSSLCLVCKSTCTVDAELAALGDNCDDRISLVTDSLGFVGPFLSKVALEIPLCGICRGSSSVKSPKDDALLSFVEGCIVDEVLLCPSVSFDDWNRFF